MAAVHYSLKKEPVTAAVALKDQLIDLKMCR
jgi:hypothetical protein